MSFARAELARESVFCEDTECVDPVLGFPEVSASAAESHCQALNFLVVEMVCGFGDCI